jgi:HPt (histidine-containing phosphotransfer) domain-containing protein
MIARRALHPWTYPDVVRRTAPPANVVAGEFQAMINVSAASLEDDTTRTSGAADRVIDLVHLTRMTLGDRSLEREVLQLFGRQATLLVARARKGSPEDIAAVAHTLKGSARGIGATRVAGAAESLEIAAASGRESELSSAVDRLAAAADEASAVISDLLRAN